MSLDSYQDIYLGFLSLCISFLPSILTIRSQLIHVVLLPYWPDFLHLMIKSSCTVWKAILKICQLCSVPLSLREVSQGVLLTNSLYGWSSGFLKFRVLTLVFRNTNERFTSCVIDAFISYNCKRKQKFCVISLMHLTGVCPTNSQRHPVFGKSVSGCLNCHVEPT